MKKKILTLTLILFISFSGFRLMAQNNTGAKSDAATSIIVKHNAVVPKNNTYYLYDEAGTKLLATFNSGQTVNLFKKKKVESKDAPKKMDCAQISCPSSFSSSVTCWKCQ